MNVIRDDVTALFIIAACLVFCFASAVACAVVVGAVLSALKGAIS